MIDYTLTKRLKEIRKRLDKIEETLEPIWDERINLEKERDIICASFARDIAINLIWKLEYQKRDYRKIILSCEDYNARKDSNKKLWKLGGNYHSTFYLDEEHDEIPEHKVALQMDDGSLYLTFESVDDYKRYLKEWNLKVDTSSFKDKLSNFKKDIEILERIIQ